MILLLLLTGIYYFEAMKIFIRFIILIEKKKQKINLCKANINNNKLKKYVLRDNDFERIKSLQISIISK